MTQRNRNFKLLSFHRQTQSIVNITFTPGQLRWPSGEHVCSWCGRSLPIESHLLPLVHACRECDQLPCLAAKRSGGVTPEVNLRNSLHTGDKACKWGIHPGFETQGRHHQKSKTGVWVAPQKGLMSSNFFKKKLHSPRILTKPQTPQFRSENT